MSLLAKGPLTEKELTRRALALGGQMFYSGEIERRESVSKSILQNAFRAFADLKYLTHRPERIELADTLTSPEAVEAIEAQIAIYLREASW